MTTSGIGGRVVKASDSKSDGLCPHRFESCPMRIILYYFMKIKSELINAL